MGFWRTTKKVVGHAVDLRFDRWLDLTFLKNSALYFWNYWKQLSSIKKEEHPETFEEAVNRLNLSPELLAQQARRYLLLTFLFLFLALMLLIYTSVILYLRNWMGACISFSLALYASSLAFRFYFWHFQITRQKLGCSIRECYQSISLRKLKRTSQR